MTPAERAAREEKKQRSAAALARYHTLRAELQASSGLTDDVLDAWIVDALSAFKICSTDLLVPDGQTHTEAVMARTSTDLKIRALEALLA